MPVENSDDKDCFEFDCEDNIVESKLKLRVLQMKKGLAKLCVEFMGTILEWSSNGTLH